MGEQGMPATAGRAPASRDGVAPPEGARLRPSRSPCRSDVAAYLTGARTCFGSHFIDPKLKESDFVVKRLSTGQTVRVVINAATYPHDVRTQMKKMESGQYEPADIDLFQDLQCAYAKKLVTRPAIESVDVIDNPDYSWTAPCQDLGTRKDNAFKHVPEAHWAMRLPSLASLILGAGLLPAAQAAEPGPVLYTRFNCTRCHGADARGGVRPDAPPLAGLAPERIEE